MRGKLVSYFNRLNHTNINICSTDEQIIDQLMLTKYINKIELINLFLCIKYRYNYIYMGEVNVDDEKMFINLNIIEREYRIMLNYSIILCNIINDFIKKDLDILNLEKNKIWVVINLSYLYNINIKYVYKDTYKILSRTKEENIRIKTLKNIVILSTLKRDSEIIFYIKGKNNLSNNIPQILVEQTKQTKGYLVCLNPEIVNKLKELKYSKKLYSTHKIEIKYLSKEFKIYNFLRNSSYSSPIWIKSYEHIEKNNENLNKFLEERINPSKIIKTINSLNSVKLSIKIELLNQIELLGDLKGNDSWKIKSRNSLVGQIYKIDQVEEEIINANKCDEIMDLNRSIQDVATFDLIKKQARDIFYYNNNLFYSSYILDTRYRIYNNAWPLNYQLNHIVRAIIQIKDIKDEEKIIKKFLKKYQHSDEILYPFYTKLNNYAKNYIRGIIGEKNMIIKEAFTQLIISIIPPFTNDENIRFIEGINLIEELVSSSEDHISRIAKEKKYDDKDLFKLLNVIRTYRDFKFRDYKSAINSTVWLDASSNSLQLVAYRLGLDNEYLLKLLNIYDNDTEYNGIYDFINKNIGEESKDPKIKELRKKLFNIDLDTIQSKKDAKRRIMPSVYGKTLFACMKEDFKIFENNELLFNTSIKEKSEISKYLWLRSLDILKENDFNIDEYKKLFNKDTPRYWKNDLELPVIINNCLKKQRDIILKKIYILDTKIKNKTINLNNLLDEDKEILKLLKDIKNLKDKLNKDERSQKRRTINIRNSKITIRIPNYDNTLDIKDINKSLLPSSIHTCDSCILIIVQKMCKKLDIEILVIHDSIGCQLWSAPIIRILFIIANIIIIKNSQKKAPYPFEKVKKNNININKILESRNIFRM